MSAVFDRWRLGGRQRLKRGPLGAPTFTYAFRGSYRPQTMNKPIQPDDSENPEEIADEIISRLDRMHDALVDSSTHVGYTRDAFRAVRPVLVRLGNTVTTDPDVSAVYASNTDFLRAFRDEIRSHENQVMPLHGLFSGASGSAYAFYSATGTTASIVQASAFAPDEPLVLNSPHQHDEYARRFSQFDHALGRTYKEIWEVLYGTRADPERAALYLIRQAFDHLFAKLSPDSEVRKSPYWTKKTVGEQDRVTREERIQYAAAKHIKDGARAKTLLSSSRHMLNVYDVLNKAHKRGKLDPTNARRALAEMQAFLEDWANAVGI